MYNFEDFDRQVARTDRRRPEDAVTIGIMGVYGELGSLLSEFKKRAREGASYVSFGGNLVEEAGDLLWYFSALGRTLGLSFRELVADALKSDVSQIGSVEDAQDLLGRTKGAALGDPWLDAAAAAGRLASAALDTNSDLRLPTTEALGAALRAMAANDVFIQEAINNNITKSESRFPDERIFLDLYDDRIQFEGLRIPQDEQLHRRLAVDFEEREIRGKNFVTQKVFQIKIGDPLTDNIGEEDDYRFHDVFHLAYAAVLGWSPVLRALFKVKRKSFPKLDEAEDGARAILIEEGISSWIFNRSKPHYFAGVERVDYEILKTIKEFTRGYEVEDQPFWAWEKAILDGYAVFRELKLHRRGRVLVDLSEREIRFEKFGT
ncbi:pyrophosphatase [Brevundimonas sp. P7753]|uniref:pyrophosphatase n=1 Tax=Brevundimonas sp. P7753 TaxID=2726982 RepID=UPI0015BBF806|nr:pyrophosphatase [Brevundimonas sp. P7753]NWE51208.1 pyrophosphatase [Brevundimonas sp. P7753]